MKKSVSIALLAAFPLYVVTAHARKLVAQPQEIVLPLSEARAVCHVAMSYVLYHAPLGQTATKEELDKPAKERINVFLSACDNVGREVTAAATITKLRQHGVNAHPAWTEKKWRSKDAIGLFRGSMLVRLKGMKPDNKTQVQWNAMIGTSPLDGEDGTMEEFSIQTKKVNGRWRITGCKLINAAG